jgi:DNA processing protein
MQQTNPHAIDTSELGAWLRLQLTPGIGSVHGCRLLKAFGLPIEVFRQSLEALRAVLPERLAQAVLEEPSALAPNLRILIDWLEQGNGLHRLVKLGDPSYPASLLAIEDPPLMLYAIGHDAAWQAFPQAVCMAMVGSRNPTPQGADNAQAFARSLAQAGLCIVSGMALGVDAAAHRGALEIQDSALPTIAVVGTGLDRVYPAQHRKLATEIATRGLLLSEYPLGSAPLAAHFPRRNRLIAGLARGTLVVEAALQSGSLITAQQALEQGKDVFAIPGSIHSTQARGCHALIKQGAQLVECVQDILESSGYPTTQKPTPEAANFGETRLDIDVECTNADTELLDAVGFDPSSLDVLQIRTGWNTARLQAQLMELELRGLIGRLPGGLFQRVQGKQSILI